MLLLYKGYQGLIILKRNVKIFKILVNILDNCIVLVQRILDRRFYKGLILLHIFIIIAYPKQIKRVFNILNHFFCRNNWNFMKKIKINFIFYILSNNILVIYWKILIYFLKYYCGKIENLIFIQELLTFILIYVDFKYSQLFFIIWTL